MARSERKLHREYRHLKMLRKTAERRGIPIHILDDVALTIVSGLSSTDPTLTLNSLRVSFSLHVSLLIYVFDMTNMSFVFIIKLANSFCKGRLRTSLTSWCRSRTSLAVTSLRIVYCPSTENSALLPVDASLSAPSRVQADLTSYDEDDTEGNFFSIVVVIKEAAVGCTDTFMPCFR